MKLSPQARRAANLIGDMLIGRINTDPTLTFSEIREMIRRLFGNDVDQELKLWLSTPGDWKDSQEG